MAHTTGNKLGTALRKARIEKGLSVRALAGKLGINFSTISYIESGDIAQPHPETLQSLSRVLGIPLEELYVLANISRKDDLPRLPIYLRSKYGLSVEESAELEEAFKRVVQRRKKGGRRAKRPS